MTVSQNYYKLYINNVIELASTIVIKSERSADVLNERILQLTGIEPDPNDKTSWKYYLNISGQYHPTDNIIEITSLDDLSKITFDKVTLINHPATLEAYKFGSRYYRELTTLYPEMQQFILGCLYPVNINTAIEVEDATILTYPKHLIEENEENLILNMQLWIRNYKLRWDNKQFNESDNLYAAANLGIMYLMLVPLIINLRLKACKTREANSYHVRQYLASHGYLDQYIDYLNLKQRLFLYRNICFIERNAGQNKTLLWLTDKLMTERNLPLAEYTMRHDNSTLPKTYYSDITFKRKSLTPVFSQTTKNNPVISLEELLDKEKTIRPGNPKYITDNFKSMDRKFENSLSSVVLTKVLESSVVDYSDSESFTLTEIKLGHWLRNSSNGLYTSIVNFKDPVTSADRSLNAFDAYIFWFYCYCASIGIVLTDIPKLFVYKATRVEDLVVSDLRQLVNNNKVTDEIIQILIDTKVNQIPTISVDAFGILIKDIYLAHKKQVIHLANQQNYDTRGQMNAVVNSLYENIEIDTLGIMNLKDSVNYSNFSQWLDAKGLNVDNYSTSTLEILHLDIFKAATGGDFYTKTQLSDLQKAMVKILTQLSSYSIQILSEINSFTIKKLGWATIRPGTKSDTEIQRHHAEIINTYVDNVVSVESDIIDIPVISIGVTGKTAINVSTNEMLEIPVKVQPGKSDIIKNYIVRLGTMIVNHSFVNPNNVDQIQHFPAYSTFFDLTDEEQKSIKDVYQNLFDPDLNINKENLNMILMRNYLPGFKTFIIKKPHLKSFIYKFIPNYTYSRIRTLVNVSMEALLPNLGSIEINAYKLLAGTTSGYLFRFFSPSEHANVFKYFASTYAAAATFLHTPLGFGTNLSAFALNKDEQSISSFTYHNNEEISITNMFFIHDRQSVNFVRDVMSRTPHHHPYLPGSLFNGFSLVNGDGVAEYKIVGFTFNGQQIIWS